MVVGRAKAMGYLVQYMWSELKADKWGMAIAIGWVLAMLIIVVMLIVI